MAHNEHITDLTLSAPDIDRLSAWVDGHLREAGAQRRDRLRACILVEDLAINLAAALGEDAAVEAHLDLTIGHARLRIEVVGDAHNPLYNRNAELDAWEETLRGANGLHARYAYVGGANVVRIKVPKRTVNPVIHMTCAALAGGLIGLIGLRLLPQPLLSAAVEAVLHPALATWTRLLTAISGPVVFLSVLSAVINTKTVERRGVSEAHTLLRYFLLSLACVVASQAVTLLSPLYSLEHEHLVVDAGFVGELITTVLSFVPENVVEPLLKADTAQLLFLSVGLGFVLMRNKGRTQGLQDLVHEANSCAMTVASWMGALVPLATCAFVCAELWGGSVLHLVGLWRPFLVSAALVVFSLVVLVLVSARILHVGAMRLMRSLGPGILVALRQGSLDAASDLSYSTLTQDLGVDAEFCRQSLPQALVLYMPMSCVCISVLTIHMANSSGTHGNLIFYVTAAVMAVVVFAATPPVPGANLLAYIAVFDALGIMGASMSNIVLFDVLSGIYAGAGNLLAADLELLYQAKRSGLMNEGKLRRDPA